MIKITFADGKVRKYSTIYEIRMREDEQIIELIWKYCNGKKTIVPVKSIYIKKIMIYK